MNQKYLILAVVTCVVFSVVGVSGYLLLEYMKSTEEQTIEETYVDPNWFDASENEPSVSQYYQDPQETKKEKNDDTKDKESSSDKNEDTFSRPSMVGNYALPAITLDIKSTMGVMLEEDLVSDTGNHVTGIIQTGKLKGGILNGVYAIQHDKFFLRFTSVYYKNKRHPLEAVAINASNQKGLKASHIQKFHTEKLLSSAKNIVKDMVIPEVLATNYGSNTTSKKPIYTLEKQAIQIRLEKAFKGEK